MNEATRIFQTHASESQESHLQANSKYITGMSAIIEALSIFPVKNNLLLINYLYKLVRKQASVYHTLA